MIIDCRICQARGIGCADCAATTVLGEHFDPDFDQVPDQDLGHELGPDLDPAEIRALTVLARAGMIPPLRFAPRLARAS